MDPELDSGVGAVEAPERRVRARRRRAWLAPLMLVSAAVAFGGWLLLARCGSAAEAARVEALSADAETFVTLVRSGLPPAWSIERVLEYAALRPSANALRELREQRGQARVNLERKLLDDWVALGGQGSPPELSGFTRWISNPAWMSRADVVALAGELGALDAGLAALRERHGLEPRPLDLGGEPLAPLPERIPLAALAVRNDLYDVRAAALPHAAVILHRGKPMGCRYQRCLTTNVTWLSWQGEPIGEASLPPAPDDARDLDTWVAPDGTVYRVEESMKGELSASAHGPDGELPMDPEAELPSAAYQYVQRLDGRDGSERAATFGDGSSLAIQRFDGTVIAKRTEPGGGEAVHVVRLADFAGANEELLRTLIAGGTGAVLVFEGERGRPSVLLSSDGGRTWVGAPAGE